MKKELVWTPKGPPIEDYPVRAGTSFNPDWRKRREEQMFNMDSTTPKPSSKTNKGR